jgi:hypothetical protein
MYFPTSQGYANEQGRGNETKSSIGFQALSDNSLRVALNFFL